jgi:bacterioferritin-associated ferredoxin
MITQQPEGLWSNRVDRRIQRGNQVRNSIEISSDCSGEWWWWWGELNSRDEQKSATSLMITEQPEGPRSRAVYRRIQRGNQVRNSIEISSDCSGEWWWWWGELNSRDDQKSATSLMITGQPEGPRSRAVYRRIQRVNQVRNSIEISSDCSGEWWWWWG